MENQALTLTTPFDSGIEFRGDTFTVSSLRVAEVFEKRHDNVIRDIRELAEPRQRFAEQLTGADVSVYHYRATFKPQSILPDVDFRSIVIDLADIGVAPIAAQRA